MSLYRELSYDHDFDLIKGIQFCIMSPEEIEKRSVAEIFKTETYNGNKPVPNGLFDARMGVIDYNDVCVTCEQKNTFCPGHFGHIKLAKPVFYVQFFGTIKKLLRCVCFRCSKLLVDPDSDEVKAILNKKHSRQKRWEAMYNLCFKVKRCGQHTADGCGAKIPTITKDGVLKIGLEWKDVEATVSGTGEKVVKKQVLNAEDVLRILRRINDEDAELLGFSRKFNRPEWMICTNLPVPPPTVRPSVRTDTGQRQEDDLTHKLSMIVKVNNNLKGRLEKAGERTSKDQVDMLTTLLQYEVATMIDNTIPGIPQSQQRTGRPIRSLTERLKSKEGRIRGNLMGKRVDFSARSVITPDPNISIDELGVPLKIAMNLTFPEIVNKYNMEEMYKLVKNGPDVYPGAKYVRKAKEGVTKRLKNMDRDSLVLEEGDIVDRHLRNGDIVLFNRQPSLHRLSMNGHRIRIMPYHTFRLNVCVTPAYNADFDGDEMNMHVPQSLQTAEELIQLAAIPQQIISPRECKPIVSIVQDIVTGMFRMTKDKVRVSEKQLFNLLCPNPKFGGRIPHPFEKKGNAHKWSGRQLLSSILPEKINLDIKTDDYNENLSREQNKNAIIKIENGEVISGVFSKDIYQSRTKGLIHQVYNEYGPDETRMLFDNTQQLVCNWLVLDGFSVGVSDMVMDASTVDNVQEILRNMKVNVYNTIHTIHQGKFENNSIKNNNELFETTVNTSLNRAIDEVGKNVKSQINEETNRLINMIKSKAKGNNINVAQMMGCVGQQNVDGRRIPYGYDDRTLPHYTKYDDGPESRGFVESSFIKGLTPQEFFFHAMGGREGLIDTAVQTSSTGYIQRRLVKAMEDCKVAHDMTVRNASGSIIQFLYGEDGMDSCKIESQSIPYIEMETPEMVLEYMFSDKAEEVQHLLAPDTWHEFINTEGWQQSMYEHLQQLLNDRDHLILKMFKGKCDTSVLYPISFQRILTIAANLNKKYGAQAMLDLNPMYILAKVDELCKDVFVTRSHRGNKLFQILVRCNLSPKKVLLKYKLNKDSFDYVVQQVRFKFYESLAHPSEMVGVIAAQSIGEPATQLTLNTFHLSGVSAASKAVRGVPRLEELLSVSKNIKSPIMQIMLHESIRSNKKKCLEVMNDIRIIRFKDIVKSSRIYFDPNDFKTNIPEDQDFIAVYNEYRGLDECTDTASSSPWLLRLELNKAKMYDFQLDMVTLHHVLETQFDDRVSCVFSDDNAENLVFRIKLNNADEPSSDDMLTDLKALEHTILENLDIKGVRNIERASLGEVKSKRYKPKSKQAAEHEREPKSEHYDENNKEFYMDQEWVVYTDGSNMRDVLALDVVDASRTITNDVNEIYEVLGIEAARQALYNEIIDVLDSIYVNYRHAALLVDVMTNKGNIVSVNRHGINRGDIGPLAKCSFEETTDKLIKAGIFAEYDKINGVAANVMLGQIAPCGTGDVDVMIDESCLDTIVEADDVDVDVEDMPDDDAMCTEKTLTMGLEVPAIPNMIERKTDNDMEIID